MGVYVKIDDSARYYYPKCITDAVTDRADEIAVGSNGGGRGYIPGSGIQDAPMVLSVAKKELIEVSQGFTFLLGSFSGVWRGAGKVDLRLTDGDDKTLFKEFLTDNPLSAYEYKVDIAVVDKDGHIVAKNLALGSTRYDSAIGKYKHTFELPSEIVEFGTDTETTAFTDLSKVSVYLRGYFREGDERHIEYVGRSIEIDGAGGDTYFNLRGFAPDSWRIYGTSFFNPDITSGSFALGVDYMPLSANILASCGAYSDSSVILRGGLIGIERVSDDAITDYIAVSQKSSVSGSLNFSMRTIRHKSAEERSFKFTVFAANGHGWVIDSKPDWVSVSGGYVTFSKNDTGEARGGIMVIRDTNNNQIYQIPCVQWGINRFYAVETIGQDGKKTVSAYAATIVKHSLDMSVAYYNAATFTLYLRQIGFNIKDFAAGGDGLATLNMKSGACGGRDFNITDCDYDALRDRWKLTLDRLEDSSLGMVFPNIAFPICEGDRFVLTDILMPEVYILVAEKRLLVKARVYYDRNSKLRYLYDLEVDSKWVKNEGVYLRPGMYMQIEDADLIGANPAYVLIDTVTVTHNESNIPVFKVTLREKLYLPE